MGVMGLFRDDDKGDYKGDYMGDYMGGDMDGTFSPLFPVLSRYLCRMMENDGCYWCGSTFIALIATSPLSLIR